MTPTWVEVAYLIAAACFIFGLKRLSSPRTAPSGNWLAAVGMFIAIVVTLFDRHVVSFYGILSGAIIGSTVGVIFAYRVPMTAMPQMVALFNGFGGLASALVAGAELLRSLGTPGGPDLALIVPIVLGTLIGSVTFTGSAIAFAKLQELMDGRPTVFPLQQAVNVLLGLALVAFAVIVVVRPERLDAFAGLAAVSSLLGILVVIRIGGADMPVVISLLNSYSGLAACATGFVLSNNVLIIAGSLVGASGIILTNIMCVAMNRSLGNVIFGAFGQVQEGVSAAAAEAKGSVKSGSPEEAAMVLDAARSVVIVPGYGLAVAQAQHAIREVADGLTKRGIEVRFAIHPVAGRMPGHMNVLLAEADVPYELLVEMDAINPSMPQTDVCLVMGANDVVNPAARDEPSSPIYGMPIIEVDKSKTVMVCKRSLNPGFAGIDNPLYYLPNTMMLFGDAKDTAMKLVAAMREL
jgi:NAD(P) transhydrogenase subunit beta